MIIHTWHTTSYILIVSVHRLSPHGDQLLAQSSPILPVWLAPTVSLCGVVVVVYQKCSDYLMCTQLGHLGLWQYAWSAYAKVVGGPGCYSSLSNSAGWSGNISTAATFCREHHLSWQREVVHSGRGKLTVSDWCDWLVVVMQANKGTSLLTTHQKPSLCGIE